MGMESNAKELAKHLIENRTKLGGGTVEEIIAAVQSIGGKVEQFDPDGPECGNFRVPHWPPKGLDGLVAALGRAGLAITILAKGIPVPDSFEGRLTQFGHIHSR